MRNTSKSSFDFSFEELWSSLNFSLNWLHEVLAWHISCQPNPSIRRRGYYKTQSINWSALMKAPPGLNPPYHATHQPGWTKAALSHCLLALLYMSQDALSLCAHIFFKVSLSLSSSASFSISPSLYPVSHWWFVFLLWDLGSHSESTLFSSYPFQRMGPERQNGWLWVPLHPTPHQPTLLSLPCDDVMAFICSGGTRWFSPSIKHSISPTSSPLPSLTFTTLFLSQSISQILWPLKGCLEDLGMFGCCLAHPWYMFDIQKKDNYPFQLWLPF